MSEGVINSQRARERANMCARVRRWIGLFGPRAHASTSRAKAVPFIYTGLFIALCLASAQAPRLLRLRYVYVPYGILVVCTY